MGIERAVITGATGPLGIALVKYLAGRDIQVSAVVHPGSKRIAYVPVLDGVRIVECGLTQLETLGSRLPHGCDVFFHLGWEATESRAARDDPFLHALNIGYTLDAVKLAHALGCSTFIGAGSQSELLGAGDLREESYGIAKRAAGRLSLRLCSQYGIRHCWTRILSIYGPGERETTALMYCIYTLLQGQKPALTRAEQLWDYLYAADCARAFYLIAQKGRHGAAYSLGSGSSKPLKEYFECTRDCIDPALPLGIGEKEYPLGQLMELSADISSLTQDTGFVPEYSFKKGICETVDWVRNMMGTVVKSN